MKPILRLVSRNSSCHVFRFLHEAVLFKRHFDLQAKMKTVVMLNKLLLHGRSFFQPWTAFSE